MKLILNKILLKLNNLLFEIIFNIIIKKTDLLSIN